MEKTLHILLISSDKVWQEALVKALKESGIVKVGSDHEAIFLVLHGSYDLVIIDALEVDDVPLLISRLHAQKPGLRIVVATAAPTWRSARESFQAGATDYILKSLSDEQILTSIHTALAKKV